jgi:NADPH-dependent 2,4-dienoyl-CoA reductase/sulfur reductase-like enzyme
MKRVVVVGGGYAGVALARALDSTAEVCLVEARDRFVHNVAAIRSVVDPTLLERIVIPYDRLLRRGRVRRGVVTSASEHDVTLASGEVIEADIVVVATGSRYAEPFKPEAESTAAFSDSVRAAHAALLAADKVAIVGGGAVGVELAGEISTIFHNKRVTLVSSSPALMPGYPARLAHSLHTQLRRQGVELRAALHRQTRQSSGKRTWTIDLPGTGRASCDVLVPTNGGSTIRSAGPRDCRPVAQARRPAPAVRARRCRGDGRSDDDRRHYPASAVAGENHQRAAGRSPGRVGCCVQAMAIARYPGPARTARRRKRTACSGPRLVRRPVSNCADQGT